MCLPGREPTHVLSSMTVSVMRTSVDVRSEMPPPLNTAEFPAKRDPRITILLYVAVSMPPPEPAADVQLVTVTRSKTNGVPSMRGYTVSSHTVLRRQ